MRITSLGVSNSVKQVWRPVVMALAAGTLLAACALEDPVTRTDVVDERPQLVVANAGEGAVLIVNGVNLGEAGRYNGDPTTLRLTSGSHVVEIQRGGQIVLKEKVFLSDLAIRTIAVPSQ